MAVEHKDAADPNIHEPKGFTAAANDTVYVKVSGSGLWQKLGPDQINLSALWPEIEQAIEDEDIQIAKERWLSIVIPDVSTANTVYVPIPVTCVFVGAYMVLGAAITGANSAVSFANAAGSSMGSSVTIVQSGSAAGNGFSFTPSANQSLVGPTRIEITTDGASSTVAPLYITLRLLIPIS